MCAQTYIYFGLYPSKYTSLINGYAKKKISINGVLVQWIFILACYKNDKFNI